MFLFVTDFLRHHEMKTKINHENVKEIIDITGVESEDSEGEFKEENWGTDDSENDSDFLGGDKEEGNDDDNENEDDKDSETESENKIEKKYRSVKIKLFKMSIVLMY